jgi:hypothetical protein
MHMRPVMPVTPSHAPTHPVRLGLLVVGHGHGHEVGGVPGAGLGRVPLGGRGDEALKPLGALVVGVVPAVQGVQVLRHSKGRGRWQGRGEEGGLARE